MSEVKDIKGKVYYQLTIIERKGSDKHGQALWLCKCTCGKLTIAVGSAIRRGITKSCGCRNGEPHGLCHHPLYNVWQHMKRRCGNKQNADYKYYGGRGIKVHPDWKKSFKSFYDYCNMINYEEGLELDRINNDGNYVPGNIRFVTRSTQTRNKRYFNNTSGYRGVNYMSDCKKKWSCTITINYKKFYMGLFSTAEEAAKAYDKKAKELLGDEAYLNFPKGV